MAKKNDPDGPLPKWGEPESVEVSIKVTPGQGKKEKKMDVKESKYSVDVDGLPRFYMDADSPAQIRKALRTLLRKASSIDSVERVNDAKIKADYRERTKTGNTDSRNFEKVDEMLNFGSFNESLRKRIASLGKIESDLKRMKNDEADMAAFLVNQQDFAGLRKFIKTADPKVAKVAQAALSVKEGYVSHAQRKAVWAARNDEKKKKMKKEDVEQVDELKKSTLMSYIGKAQQSKGKMLSKQAEKQRANDYTSANAMSKKIRKRDDNINRATMKVIKKEEIDLDEGVKHDRYERSHGKKASGKGMWAFTDKSMGKGKEYFHKTSDTLSNAAKHAQKALGTKDVYVMESSQFDEAVSVDSKQYSWGKMMTVKHGSSHSFPLHPQHQSAIRKLKDGESTKFKDETGSHVTASRKGDHIHLKKQSVNKTTKVAHSHFSEEVEQIDELKSSTYRSYVDKAQSDQIARMKKKKQTEKDKQTMRKRSLGIATAQSKQYGDKRSMGQRIRGEEVELDEVSSATINSYVNKRNDQIDAKRAAGDRAGADRLTMKKWKTVQRKADSNSRAAEKSGANAKAREMEKKMPLKYSSKMDHYVPEGETLDEKLNPSMGAGEYVKDFRDSDAPQFKGKSDKKKQKMAIAAYLSAKRGEK